MVQTLIDVWQQWRLDFACLLAIWFCQILFNYRFRNNRVKSQTIFNLFFLVANVFPMAWLMSWVGRATEPFVAKLRSTVRPVRLAVRIDFSALGIPKYVSEICVAILMVILFDFFQYWSHRLQHTRMLYRPLHQFHHNVRMTVLVGYRHHPLENIYIYFLISLPTTLLYRIVGPGGNYMWIQASLLFIAIFTHADISIPEIPIISAVMILPNHHRIHHSALEGHWDKNFGNFTTIWDRLFGTYVHPYRNGETIYPDTGNVRSFASNAKGLLWLN